MRWYIFAIAAVAFDLVVALLALDFTNDLTPASRITLGAIAVAFDIVAGHLAWLAERKAP